MGPFHQRCRGRARDEPATTPLAPARVKHAMQFFQMTSELFDIDMYHHSAEISSFVQHFQFSASLELLTARYSRDPL